MYKSGLELQTITQHTGASRAANRVLPTASPRLLPETKAVPNQVRILSAFPVADGIEDYLNGTLASTVGGRCTHP
jgi:hypothetical protein